MSGKGNNGISFLAIVTIGVATVAAGALALIYMDKVKIKGNTTKKIDEDTTTSAGGKGYDDNNTTTSSALNKNKPYSTDVIIEDASDDDDDDDYEDEDDENLDDSNLSEIVIEERQKQEELKALQDEYEKTVNLAAKYLKGNMYQKSAEKYTEAIQLASKIPSQGKDLITLYNNRSATYEKSGDFKQSLSDISVVLAMDVLHVKGRTRRARVLEALGKIKEALDEYTLTMVIERDLKGIAPSNGDKVDFLAKKVAVIDAAPKIKEMRNSPGRSLPSKAYCRNFVETFSSTHKWISQYKGKQTIESDASDANEQLQKAICDLVNGNYISAFEEINQLRTSLTEAEGGERNNNEIFSTVVELSGTEKYLKCNLDGAINDFNQAVQLNEHNFEAQLKLASIYLELGELDNAAKTYEEIITKLETSESTTKDIEFAWVLVHRSSLWVTKNDEGALNPDAIEKSIKDIDNALELLEPFVNEYPEAKAGKLICLLKSIHILSQTKAMMGLFVTEDDNNRNEISIAEAKNISPTHDSVRILESDSKASVGSFDEALAIIEELIKDSDPGDSIPLVVKGNLLTQRAVYELTNSQGNPSVIEQSRQVFKDVEEIYEHALKIEPNGVEALIQHAHMMNMTGQNEAGEKLVNEAIPYARSRDELIELCQLLALTRAQIYSSNLLKPQIERIMGGMN